MNQCPACGSTETRWADRMGLRIVACCRLCGMEYSRHMTEEEIDDDAEVEDEPDGQPDEMQEWHDFNPDC